MMPSTGDIAEIIIDDLGVNGEGVGRQQDGLVVFAEGTVPGDRALVRLTQVKKGWARASIVEIAEYSKERINPVCGSFGVCGGCRFLHVNYDTELKFKLKKVNDALRRIGGLDFYISDIIGMEEPCFYRNKVTYHACAKQGAVQIGFYAAKSNKIAPVDECVMLGISRGRLTDVFKRYINERGALSIKEITLRLSAYTGGVLVNIASFKKNLPNVKELARNIEEALRNAEVFGKSAKLEGITLSAGGNPVRTVWGNGFIVDEIGDFVFKVSALSFFQVNSKMTEVLYDKVLEYAAPSKSSILLDAYAGTGTISIYVSPMAGEVIGIELEGHAVLDAEENAQLNGASNVRFIQGEAASVMEKLDSEKVRPDTVILDPPRSGCGRKAVCAIERLSPKTIVYVSCDPATLARDLRDLRKIGYTPESGVCVDMFGRSAHVETVVLMTRRLNDS